MQAVARTRTCMHTPAFSVLDPGGVVGYSFGVPPHPVGYGSGVRCSPYYHRNGVTSHQFGVLQ